jgi:pimeloyl-ACP methyl ester carboxylesterase
MAGASSASPDWFTRAITAKRDSQRVTVEGCSIHYLRWGDPTRPGLALIPPSGGHAHWFAHVAPLLADQFHVVALDPSGCGDSGRRDAYTRDLVSAEIAAICEDCGMFRASVKPTLVGHSAGAQFAVRAALAFGERLLGVMAVDGLRYAELDRDPAVKALKGPRPMGRQARAYASLDEAVAHFRLAPAPLAPIENGFVIDYIARHSFRERAGGWISKFDPAQAATIGLALELRDTLKDLKCAAAVIYAERTHLADESAADIMTELNDGRVPVFVIPGSSHYPQIDSPFSFVTAIKAVALTWMANSSGHPRPRMDGRRALQH